jgi:hypothetical protein
MSYGCRRQTHAQTPHFIIWSERWTHNIKSLYLLKGTLHCYRSCATLKPKHYHLVSDFNTGPNKFHIILQSGKCKLTTFLQNAEDIGEGLRYLKFIVPVHQVMLDFFGRHPQNVFLRSATIVLLRQHISSGDGNPRGRALEPSGVSGEIWH